MTIKKCLIKLTKTEMLKGSKKFKSTIVYYIKLMSLNSCELIRILKSHNIIIRKLLQVISFFLLFSFSAISSTYLADLFKLPLRKRPRSSTYSHFLRIFINITYAKSALSYCGLLLRKYFPQSHLYYFYTFIL